MKAVCQRVTCATLYVDGELISKIDKGFLVYVGYSVDDTKENITKALNKISGLRVFDDPDDKLNLSLSDIGGQMLLVSNFTIYGDCSRGFRPSFVKSASFDKANDLYNFSLEYIKNKNIDVKPCVFGGDMYIESVADGPINVIIDSEEL